MRIARVLLFAAMLLALCASPAALAAEDRFLPLQVATGPDGNVYAFVDGNTSTPDHVFVYAPDGRLLKTLDPQVVDLTLDDTGNLYVLDRVTNRSLSVMYYTISRIDRGGNTTVLWSNANTGNREVAAITAGPGGIVYFSTFPDNGYNGSWEINAVDANGTLKVICTKNVTALSDEFLSLAVDRNGTVYTAGVSNRITVISPDGTTKTIGKLGSDNGTFNWISDIAIGRDGYLYVAELGNRRIQKLTTDGAYVAQWTGCGPDPFMDHLKIATDENDRVYIADEKNERIVWLTQGYTYGLDKAENMKGQGSTWGVIYAGANYSAGLLERQFEDLQNNGGATPAPGLSSLVSIAGLFLAGAVLYRRRVI